MRYSIYGLCLEADVPIPGLAPCADDRAADVRVWLIDATSSPVGSGGSTDATSERIWYRSPARDEATGDPALTIFKSAEGTYRLRYADGVQLVIDRSGTDVRVRRAATLTEEVIAIYLTGSVLGFLLRLRGVVSLHASAVAIGDCAVAFVGSAGSGKSTTAAAFVSLGYPVLTEEVAALSTHDGAFAIRPGYPRIGLWSDSAAMLFGSPDALPRFTPQVDKRCLDLAATGGFVGQSLPLRAIYVLSGPGGSEGPRVVPLPAGSAMLELLGNVYGNHLLHRELRVKELDMVCNLVATVPVSVTAPSEDPKALCEVVLDDLADHARSRPGRRARRGQVG